MPIDTTPMEFVLQRQPTDHGATLGEVTLLGSWFCDTCEDPIREVPGAPVNTWKRAGDTAIPQGRYPIIVTVSVRFGRRLPLLVDVPGFEGIRIHPGNTAADTRGCLLPGMSTRAGAVVRSREACATWQGAIETALLAGRSVWIEIRNP